MEFNFSAHHAMTAMKRNRWFTVSATGVTQEAVDSLLQRVTRQKKQAQAGPTSPTAGELLSQYVPYDKGLKNKTHMFMPSLRDCDTRIRTLASPMRCLTLVYDRSGLNDRNFDKYFNHHIRDMTVEKAKVLVPKPQHLGVLAGLPWDTPWSEAKGCTCTACTGSSGKPRGTPGGLQRANLLCPLQLFFIVRTAVALLASAMQDDSGRDSDAHVATAASATRFGAVARLASTHACYQERTQCATERESSPREGRWKPSLPTIPEVTEEPEEALIQGGIEESIERLEKRAALREPSASTATDEQAREYLRLLHKRLGHAPVAELRRLYKSGAIVGMKITDDQFNDLQLNCTACARAATRQRENKRHPRTRRELRVLQEVAVDVVTRECASAVIRGEHGNFKQGGNKYAVVYMDRATDYGFIDFIAHKSDLEASVARMRCHMETEANKSKEYSGTRLRVGAWVSDQDANMTSAKAVAMFLKDRIEHVQAAADAKNQTPRLDRYIRHLNHVTARWLDDAGLPLELWEVAMRHAVDVTNHRGSTSHPLKHSPHRRWTGMPTNTATFVVFGADAYPYHDKEKRPRKSKIEPTSPGGEGRYRYIGRGRHIGGSSLDKAHLVLDTVEGVARLMMHVTFNEDMDIVRELELPGAPSDEWIERWALSQKDHSDKAEGVDCAVQDTESAATIDAETTSTSIASGPVFESKDEEGAVRDEPIPEDQPEPVPAVRSKNGEKWLARRHLFGSDAEIRILQKNPKRSGTLSHRRYEKYKAAKTVKEFLELGGTRGDLRHDTRPENGFIVALHTTDAADYGEPIEHWLDRVEPGLGERCGPIMCDEGFEYTEDIESSALRARTRAVRTIARSLTGGAAQKVKRAMDRIRRATGTHAEAFHAERQKLGVDEVIPKHATAQDRLSPYWEASAAYSKVEGRGLTDGAHLIAHLAEQYAEWHRKGDAESMDTLTELASRVFDEMTDGYHAFLVEELAHIRASAIPTPKSFREAQRGEFAKYWIEAIDAEVKNLEDFHVFKWVDRKPGMHLIDGRWVFKAKSNEAGLVARFKARLVARGFKQIYGVDYCDSSSPVGKLDTFRILVAEAAQTGRDVAFLDIKSAYLTADLKIKQFMEAPKGVTPPKPGQVMQLDKGLYGLVQGARAFHHDFRQKLLKWGYKASAADPCLFVRRDAGRVVRLLLFVDDMAIFTDRTAAGKRIKADLIAKVEKEYQYSSSDDDDVYLGINVKRVGENGLLLRQTRYIDDLIERFGMQEFKPTHAVASGEKITTDDCYEGEPKDNPLGKRFREMCGALRWLEQCTRLDISARLSELCKVQANPGAKHMRELTRLMSYVATTKAQGILYGGPITNKADGPLVGYCDADWGGDPDTFKSRGGYIFTAWQAPVAWSSFKMHAVAASSCESEYMAASAAVKQVLWLRYVFSDMGYGDLSPTTYGKLSADDYEKKSLGDVHPDERPVMIACDNKAAIHVSENPVCHKRSKHIHINYHITKQHVAKKNVRFNYINTKENLADIMTKAVTKDVHDYLCGYMMYSFEGDVLRSFKGDVVPLNALRAATDPTLYAVDPPGLLADDLLTPPTRRRKGQAHSGSNSAQVLSQLVSGPPATYGEWISRADEASRLRNAIVDSGASFTYVTAAEVLDNAKESTSAVWVANGQREAVLREGDIGPLRGVKQVQSFKRSLVSVADLVEQFGGLFFDAAGVHVVSPSADGVVVTTVGIPTKNRLFSFNVDALSAHRDAVGGYGGQHPLGLLSCCAGESHPSSEYAVSSDGVACCSTSKAWGGVEKCAVCESGVSTPLQSGV